MYVFKEVVLLAVNLPVKFPQALSCHSGSCSNSHSWIIILKDARNVKLEWILEFIKICKICIGTFEQI